MAIYSSNIKHVIAELTRNINDCLPGGKEYERINRTASLSMLAVISKRIHEKGLAADDGIIGNYSTKPLYVSKSANAGNNAKFGQPVGKNGEAIFKGGKKAGKPHTSKYFEDGYLGFKNAIGRNQLGTVNLSLSGQMNMQFSIIKTDKGWGLGWPNEEMYLRALALEKKYKKPIWALTNEERGQLNEIYQEEIKNALLRSNSSPN